MSGKHEDTTWPVTMTYLSPARIKLQLLPTVQISRQRLILSPGDAVIFLKSNELQGRQWIIPALCILERSELFGVYF